MKLDLQRPLDQFVASGGQLALLAFGFVAHAHLGASPALWAGVLVLIATLSLYGWVLALRRRRVIVDTPTARVATAPQGFVELVGRGRLFDGNPVASPLTGLPCLWYRYRTERKNADNKWELVHERQSDDSIILADDSGEAVIDPERAEIITRHRERWHDGDYRHTEWKLIAGDPLYVLGDLKTIGGHSLDLDANADTAQLLAEWKRDRDALHERFDLDANGQIDQREWSLARSAARREVARAHREARARRRAPRPRPQGQSTVPDRQHRPRGAGASIWLVEPGPRHRLRRLAGGDPLDARAPLTEAPARRQTLPEKAWRRYNRALCPHS